MTCSENIVQSLFNRSIGKTKNAFQIKVYSTTVHKRIDENFNNISSSIQMLSKAIHSESWSEVGYCVGNLITRLLDSTNPDQLFLITPSKKQEREIFVFLGGFDLLLKLFSKPFSDKDARSILSLHFQRRSELYNEVLIILREVAFAIPSLSEHIFSNDHIIFLFTLLSHQSVFENTMNLLEEILSARIDTFSLALIPNFYSLVNKFNARQLAHFCRVLSLVLFEPEDRQIMEGAHILRSVELLQLRRDRMAKINNIVERNQSMIIEMPELLPRLVQIMRIVNHGPSLADLLRQNAAVHTNLTNDIIHFMSFNQSGIPEWSYFAGLDAKVQESSSATANGNSMIPPGNHYHDNFTSDPNAAAPSTSTTSIPSSDLSVTTFINVMQIAQSLGMFATSSASSSLTSNNRNVSNITLENAKKELLFQAMLLIPHQVELLFVLCTLLSGRRKIDVQMRLASLNLSEALHTMFHRMSWSIPTFQTGTSGPLEHIHGPGCECNPESALRIQYLRLVHNFYDRDFLDDLNGNKFHLVTAQESSIISSLSRDMIQKIIQQNISSHPDALFIALSQLTCQGNVLHTGLLTQLARTLIDLPLDSAYRFWMSSCLEAFLRGSDTNAQIFVAISGVLRHIAHHVSDAGVRSVGAEGNRTATPLANNMQTSFDLLGELVKGNETTLGLMELCLEGDRFGRFMAVVLDNLVDSNVFVRSLYLSLHDQIFTPPIPPLTGYHLFPQPVSSYLGRSWEQCQPTPLIALPVTITAPMDPLRQGHLPKPGRKNGHEASFLILRSGVNPQLQRTTDFLLKNRSSILLKLMSIVTLASVNHENICCLNTALLLLIMAHRSGNLAKLLEEVRRKANCEGCVLGKRCRPLAGGMCCECGGKAEAMDLEDPPTPCNGATAVMGNFRLLLWYWKEYYERRGRDRLSIEFSSHISFHVWAEVVDLLCKDDGSPTSLLAIPIQLPQSPYNRPPRVSSTSTQDIVVYDV